MAKLDSTFAFTGSLGNLSAYTMRGVDKVVLRSKGGASKEKIKSLPSFDNTRRHNAEFGGRARSSSFIMHAMWAVKPLADYNVAGPLNGMLNRIQTLDIVNVFGQRDVMLSRNPRLLEGFSLNRQMQFDSVVRNALLCTLSREKRSVELEIPELVQGINLFTPKSHPYFSIVLTLGVIPDLFYTNNGYAPSHAEYHQPSMQRVVSPWYAMQDGAPVTTLQLALPSTPPDDKYTLLAAVGIRYGSPIGNEITQVRHAGSAKVCGVV